MFTLSVFQRRLNSSSHVMMHVVPAPNSESSVIVKYADTVNGRRFIAAVDSILTQPGSRVAFDCEGVDLSRLGTVEIVSICFPTREVFLVDFGQSPCPQVVRAVNRLMESTSVTKIIHDCR